MLVLDPHRRYTIEQIKHHRWMLIEVMDPISLACDNQNVSARSGTAITEPNEQILRLMAGLGIDTKKTCDSLKVSTPFFSSTLLIRRPFLAIYNSVFMHHEA